MKKKTNISQLILLASLLIVLALLFLPVWFSLVMSFTSATESLKGGLSLWPSQFSAKGYVDLFYTINYLRPLLISTFITVIGTGLHVILCSLAAYVLIQKRVPGIKMMTAFILITMAVPQQVLMIPTYILYKNLGLINTLTSQIIYGGITGFSILLMNSYFKGVPYDLAESARIDGANEWTIFWRIYMPMGLPGIVTIMIYDAITRWNNYTSALLFITKPELFTVQLVLKTIVTPNEQISTNIMISPNVQMAAVIIGLLPLVVLYLIMQKYIIKGVGAGAVKE